MGFDVKVTTNPAALVQLAAGRRVAMLAAAEATVLPDAVDRAPYEDEPRHGEHLRDTAFARFDLAAAGHDSVIVGFGAFWAAFQHEHTEWHHTQGEAKFLENAMLAKYGEWLAETARLMAVEA